VQVLLELIMH